MNICCSYTSQTQEMTEISANLDLHQKKIDDLKLNKKELQNQLKLYDFITPDNLLDKILMDTRSHD